MKVVGWVSDEVPSAEYDKSEVKSTVILANYISIFIHCTHMIYILLYFRSITDIPENPCSEAKGR